MEQREPALASASDRVLHLAAADSAEGAARAEPDGHLRQNGQVLEAPSGELATRRCPAEAGTQTGVGLEEPTALFREVAGGPRKCRPEMEPHVRAIFERQPFGELERLVTKQLLDVVKGVAKKNWRMTTGFVWWRSSAAKL